MGYYIETPEPTNKAGQLIASNGAVPVDPNGFEFKGLKVLVCVVQNGIFDAAGIIFDARELDAFTQPNDMRIKTWISLSRDEALKLCPKAARVL